MKNFVRTLGDGFASLLLVVADGTARLSSLIFFEEEVPEKLRQKK